MRLAIICLSITALMLGSAFAVPYASYIRVSDITVQPGDGLDISYILNEDADSITVELIPDGGGAAVATTTFTSPAAETTSGLQTVSWDGTADFAGGAQVGEGDYRVQITADKAVAAGWAEITSNRSVGAYDEATVLETIFDGYSGKDILIQTDPDSNLFGVLLCSSSYVTIVHAGVLPLRTDLNTFGGGDGFADIILQNPDPLAPINNQSTWGSTLDPTIDDLVWIVGQDSTGTNFMNALAGGPTIPAFLSDADPLDLFSGSFPRSIAILDDAGTRYAILAYNNNEINVVSLDGSNNATGAVSNILDTGDANRYSKDVEIDAAGNLYWANRRNDSGTGEGGRVYRWDNATVLAAIADPVGATLTDANASWIVDAPTGASNLLGVTIDTDGNVYTAVASTGIYLVDNVATASVVRTLGAPDQLIDFTAIGVDGWDLSTFGSNVAADAAGNLFVTDTANEQIRSFGPGGTTSETFVAPTSQTIAVATVTAARDWNLYE
jgi:hypothetical protein